jgi:hypothetical protein
MSRLKKPPLKRPKQKDLSGFENLTGLTLEYDSCYRGKIEIWKDGKGEVVYQKIVR